MTRTSSCHLLDILAEVPDPRNKKGKRHPLVSILALIVIGLMSNHKGYTSIATWAGNQPALQRLKLQRGHWTIENKVHWMPDNVLGEDASQARTGNLPHVMAALRNTVSLSALRFDGQTKIAETLRFFASEPKLTVNLIR